jgi:hypothetical protein
MQPMEENMSSWSIEFEYCKRDTIKMFMEFNILAETKVEKKMLNPVDPFQISSVSLFWSLLGYFND